MYYVRFSCVHVHFRMQGFTPNFLRGVESDTQSFYIECARGGYDIDAPSCEGTRSWSILIVNEFNSVQKCLFS